MSLKAGRVGVNPNQVDPVDGSIKSSATEGYTKQEADEKFLAKQDATDTFSTKEELQIAINNIDLLMGSKLSYVDNSKLGAKNLFAYPYQDTTKSSGGVTFTDNKDGTITVNASEITVSSNDFRLHEDLPFNPTSGSYIFSVEGLVSGLSILINAYNDSTFVKSLANVYWNDNIKNLNIDYNGYNNIRWILRAASGKTFSNNIVKPMLRISSDPNNIYIPFAMTNRDLTVNKLDISVLKSITADANDFAAFKTAIANL